MQIKPASKNQIKNRKKLLAGKYRKKEGLFLAEGLRSVQQILDNGIIEVVEIFIEAGFEIGKLQAEDLPVFSVSADGFADISDTETPQGIIAVCRIPNEPGFKSIIDTEGVFLALDAIQDPGNLGTMIRTAAWFGVKGLVFGTGTVDPFHPKVVRSTAGATGAIPAISGDLDAILKKAEDFGWSVFLMDGSFDSTNIKQIEIPSKSIVVIGNEGRGVSQKLFTVSRKKIKIEGRGSSIESLNASIACAIALSRFC